MQCSQEQPPRHHQDCLLVPEIFKLFNSVVTKDDNKDNLAEDGTKEHRAHNNRELEHVDVDKNINSAIDVDQWSIL